MMKYDAAVKALIWRKTVIRFACLLAINPFISCHLDVMMYCQPVVQLQKISM